MHALPCYGVFNIYGVVIWVEVRTAEFVSRRAPFRRLSTSLSAALAVAVAVGACVLQQWGTALLVPVRRYLY